MKETSMTTRKQPTRRLAIAAALGLTLASSLEI